MCGLAPAAAAALKGAVAPPNQCGLQQALHVCFSGSPVLSYFCCIAALLLLLSQALWRRHTNTPSSRRHLNTAVHAGCPCHNHINLLLLLLPLQALRRPHTDAPLQQVLCVCSSG
jgi:hypothetical protein